jgi:hypothetical protein
MVLIKWVLRREKWRHQHWISLLVVALLVRLDYLVDN